MKEELSGEGEENKVVTVVPQGSQERPPHLEEAKSLP